MDLINIGFLMAKNSNVGAAFMKWIDVKNVSVKEYLV